DDLRPDHLRAIACRRHIAAMLRLARAAAIAVAVSVSGTAWSHPSALPQDSPGWTLAPWVVLPLALSLGLYACGAWRLFPRSQLGRSILRRRAILFALGWLTLAVAAISPLHQAGERSFTLHMLEHELLMLV